MSNWNTNGEQGGWYGGGGAWNQSAGGGFEMPDVGGEYQPESNYQDFYGSGGGSKFEQPNVRTPNFYSGNVFNPQSASFGGATAVNDAGGVEGDEQPLLEELGINFDHIRQKTMSVLNPMRVANADAINDNDLAGPLVFCLLFGASLLLHGKVQFGYIYGIGVLGCLGMYALLNLMSANGITLTCTVSVLGYCLLPMSILSLIAAVFSFKGVVGMVLSGAAVLWCSSSASKLFVIALSMDSQRLLVAYPCSLLYVVFAFLAIF